MNLSSGSSLSRGCVTFLVLVSFPTSAWALRLSRFERGVATSAASVRGFGLSRPLVATPPPSSMGGHVPGFVASPLRSTSDGSEGDEADGLHGDDGDDDEGFDGLVTKEMFYRDLLGEGPTVRRKKKNGKVGYRTLDNRDNLPFQVKLVTPDPYTKPEVMRERAKKNTKKHRDGANGDSKDSNKKKGKNRKRTDLVGVERGIAASLYARTDRGDLAQILGEFHMDKSTTAGDLISVGDVEYEVQKARCQYKYAGGKRFVMVRKILEVKEVTRVAQENFLKRQLSGNTNHPREK